MSKMTTPVAYTAFIGDVDHKIKITPVVKTSPEGNVYATGVFKLSEGNTSLGDIVFDDNFNQWEYTGLGDLTHKEAGRIADYIRNYIHH